MAPLAAVRDRGLFRHIGLSNVTADILLIPGTSSVAHLRENLAAAGLALPDDAMAALDTIATRAA